MPRAKPKTVPGLPPGSQLQFGSENQIWSKDHSMLPHKQHEVFCKLIDMFSGTYDIEIIQSVGQSCGFKFEQCLNMMLAMSGMNENAISTISTVQTVNSPYSTQNKDSKNVQISTLNCSTEVKSRQNIAPSGNHLAPTSSNLTPPPVMSSSSHVVKNANLTGAIPKKTSMVHKQIDSATTLVINRIQILLKHHIKLLVLMRGLPGSGKSFLAERIHKLADYKGVIVSADAYFVTRTGEYKFIPNELQNAHKHARKQAMEAMKRNIPLVIVDNTNLQAWEMANYVAIGLSFKYHMELLEPDTPWRDNPVQLAKRNQHGVPMKTIENMQMKFEKLTVDSLLEKLNYGESFQVDVRKLMSRHTLSTQAPGHPKPSLAAIESTETTQHVPTTTTGPCMQTLESSDNVLAQKMSPFVPLLPPKKKDKEMEDLMPLCRINYVNGASKPAIEFITKYQQRSNELRKDQPTDIPYSFNTSQFQPAAESMSLPVMSSEPEANTKNVTMSTSMPICSSPQQGALDYLNSLTQSDDESSEKLQQNRSCITSLISDKAVNIISDISIEKNWEHAKEKIAEHDSLPLVECKLENVPAVKKSLPLSDNSGILILNSVDDNLINVTENKANTLLCSEGHTTLKPELKCTVEAQEAESGAQTCVSNITVDAGSNEKCLGITKESDSNLQCNYAFYNEASSTHECSNASSVLSLNQTIVAPNAYANSNVEEDTDNVQTSTIDSLNKLHGLFPQLLREDLVLILEEYHGDVEWAIECILHSSLIIQESSSINNNQPNFGVLRKHSSITMPSTSTSQQTSSPSRKEKVQQSSTEEALEMKRLLEETVALSKDNYNKRMVLNKRSGAEVGVRMKSPPIPSHLLENKEIFQSDTEEEEEEEDANDNQYVQMNLTKAFAENLLFLFGGPLITKMKDFSLEDLNVKLPIDLAKQIHSHWLESLHKRFDEKEKLFNLRLKNDERLAQELHQSCHKQGTSSSQRSDPHPLPADIPDLKEIMEMEMALACVKNDQKEGCRNDMATKLSRQLLGEQFPKLDPQALDNVFDAHNRCYKDTVDAIIASFGGDDTVYNVMAPEALAKYEKELLERARQESAKMAENLKVKVPKVVEVIPSKISSNLEEDRQQALTDAQYYRDEAQKQYKLRMENFRKAQEALRKGQTGVASYYSELCGLNKRKMDLANSAAAAALFGQASDKTLDLHYLYVMEAIEVLDVFLDHHARCMSNDGNTRTKTVEIITGRGIHSEGGKSRLKTPVEKRLNQRGLRYEAINPGAIRVFLTRNMVMSGK